MRACLAVLVLVSIAHADRAGPPICTDLDDCDAKCTKGNADACYVAGTMANPGEGSDAGRAKSIGYFDRACKRKLTRGCTALGGIYRETGDARDARRATTAYKKAAKYFERGCKKKRADDCTGLSGLYAAGLGVKKNADKAEHYRQRACQLTTGRDCPPPITGGGFQ
jgi:hypothetical protein